MRRHHATAALWLSGAIFWLLFAFASIAHAQDEYQYFRFADFSGGVNYAASDYLLADNEASDLLNMVVTKTGAIEKRNGYTQHSTIENGISAGTAPISLFRYYDNAGTGTWLCHAGTKVFKFTAGTATWSAITSGVSLRQSSWANLLGKAYFANEADGLCEWDGSTWTAVAAAPKCRYIVAHNQRLYMAGRDGYPTTIYYSGLRNGRIWDDVSLAAANAGYWNIVTPDNSGITGFAPWQNYLAVFTSSAILALTGSYPAEQAFNVVSSQIGCTAPRSIARVGDTVAFKYLNNVYLLNSPPAKVGAKLGSQMSNATNSVALVYHDDLIVCDPGANEIMDDTDSVYVFDTQFQRWTRWDDIPMSCGAVASANGEDALLFGDSALDRVLEWDTDVYTDALGRNTRNYPTYGGQYPGYVTTKRFNFGAPELDKVFRHMSIDIYGTSGSMRCEYEIDYGRVSNVIASAYTLGGALDAFALGTSLLGGASGAIINSAFRPDDTGKNIRFKFTNDEVGDQFQVRGLVARFRPKAFRGEE